MQSLPAPLLHETPLRGLRGRLKYGNCPEKLKKRAPDKRNAAKGRLLMGKLSLQFNISAAQAHRAYDAPYDNGVVETLHGVPVSDPFRPLETLDAPETAAWAARENAA